MSWKPIVVGVDESPESACAAALGWRIAQAAGVTCHFVHATRDIRGSLDVGQTQEAAKDFQTATAHRRTPANRRRPRGQCAARSPALSRSPSRARASDPKAS